MFGSCSNNHKLFFPYNPLISFGSTRLISVDYIKKCVFEIERMQLKYVLNNDFCDFGHIRTKIVCRSFFV